MELKIKEKQNQITTEQLKDRLTHYLPYPTMCQKIKSDAFDIHQYNDPY